MISLTDLYFHCKNVTLSILMQSFSPCLYFFPNQHDSVPQNCNVTWFSSESEPDATTYVLLRNKKNVGFHAAIDPPP